MSESRLKCLIVEDEALAAEIIADYVAEVPYLEVVACFGDAISALEYLRQNPLDVIFLDIHLPRLKGLDFLRTLTNPPQVILTTAYPNYALESYELGVVDYLLKPIDFPRFLQAVNRLRRSEPERNMPTPEKEEPLVVTINKEHLRLDRASIRYVEGMREYVGIHSGSERLVVKESLKHMLKLLGDDFLQIHKSFLVSKSHISAYSASTITLGEDKLPIGRQYREQVKQALQDWK